MVNKYLKYVLYILMIISLFFTIKNKVHAQTTSYAWGTSVVSTSTNSSLEITRNTNFMQSLGEGKIIFNFSLQGNATIYNVVAVTYNNGTATNWQCDFGSLTSYYTNNETVQTATAICPIGYTGNQGLRKIFVSFRSNGTGVSLGLGDYFTFTNSDISNTDYTTLLNTINTNINNLATKMNSVYSKLNDINTNMVSKFNDILTKIETNNTTLNTTIQQQTQQQHQDSQNTQQKIEDVNNTIKDSNVDTNNANNTFDSLNNNMASNSTISDLLLMPIHFLQRLLNAFNGTCNTYEMGELLGEDFNLPCIDISSIIGSTLWNVVDVVASGMLAFCIGKKMVKIFNQFTNLKEGGLESAYD